MGAIELAQAFEDTRSQQWPVLMSDVLGMQGLSISLDELRSFHTAVPTGVVKDDVVYGEAGGRKLTGLLYRGDNAGTDPKPGVVLVHGGGWMSGHAYLHARHAAQLAADGFVALTINYRLMQEAAWPAALDDCIAAVEWFGARDDVDRDRIAITGGSAGGHLAAMVATTGGVKAAVLWYPVADLTMPNMGGPVRDFMLAQVRGYLGDVSLEHASPGTHVKPGHPSVLTLIGDADQITPLADAQALHAIYDANGVPNSLVVMPGAVHGFEQSPAGWEQSYPIFRDYLRSTLGGNAESSARSVGER